MELAEPGQDVEVPGLGQAGAPGGGVGGSVGCGGGGGRGGADGGRRRGAAPDHPAEAPGQPAAVAGLLETELLLH